MGKYEFIEDETRFQAQTNLNGKNYFLGVFKTKELAEEARKYFRNECNGDLEKYKQSKYWQMLRKMKATEYKNKVSEMAEVFMETENFKIYIPFTYEAMRKLGQGTDWLGARDDERDRRYFENTVEEGTKYYVIINKKNSSEKYLWDTSNRDLLNVEWDKIGECELYDKYPELKQFFNKVGYNISSIEEYRNGKDYIYNGEAMDEKIAPHVKKIVIPEGTQVIEYEAFKKCTLITEVSIPNSVQEIQSGAFEYCSSLKSISIPDSVQKIGTFAFACCESLTSVKLPSSLAKIGRLTFGLCKSLTSINIPSGVKYLGEEAFGGCKSLSTITLPEGLRVLDEGAFYDCPSLTTINIPDSVQKIEEGAFKECPSLVIKTKNPYAIKYCKANNLHYEAPSQYEFEKTEE